MPRTLAALALIALSAPAAGGRVEGVALAALPAAPSQDKAKEKEKQDEFVEMKWEFKPEDKFEFKWSFSEQRKTEPGVGATMETNDKREVEAELTVKDDPAWQGRLLLTLKKVVWVNGTHDFDVTLTFAAGKPANVQSKIKADARKPEGEMATVQAAALTENMKKMIEGEFSIDTARRGETVLLRNGAPSRMGGSLFDKLSSHPKLPAGSVNKDQSWKDPVPQLPIPGGLIEVKTIEYKVVKVDAKDVTVKGGFTVPIVKPPSTGIAAQKHTGNYTFTQECSYSRENHLQLVKEESLLTEKVDASGPEAFFYKKNGFHNIRQTLTIKKRPPPKEEKKPEGKK